MRSSQIKSNNPYISAVNNKVVEAKEYNELQLDVEELRTTIDGYSSAITYPIILTDTVWDDLRAPATGINPVGSPSPATPSTTDGSLVFSKGNVCIAWFQLPHAWKEGTDIILHIHWSKSTTNAGVCNWQMKYKWFNIGSVDPGFSVLAKGTEMVPNSNVANKHALLEWADLSGAGKTISSMVCVYVQRVNDGDDTFTGDGLLYEIDCHYQIDTLGSNEEYMK